jgi:hypothetical protein
MRSGVHPFVRTMPDSMWMRAQAETVEDAMKSLRRERDS